MTVAGLAATAGDAAPGQELKVKLGPMRSNDPPVGQQVAGVFEHHDVVAEQTPALLRVGGHDASGLAVRRVRRGTGRPMRTVHDGFPGVHREVYTPIKLAQASLTEELPGRNPGDTFPRS
jgi:hypothetical protein